MKEQSREGTQENFLLKDALFNAEKVGKIAEETQKAYAAFEKQSFSVEVLEKFPQLKLKERMYHIRDLLKQYSP